jgi:hypothetical protein
MYRSKLLASVAGATTLAALSVAALGLMAVAAPTPAHAANPVCPTIVDNTGPSTTNCNDYITLTGTPGGGFTVTETFPVSRPYDGSDDNYIGIFNNTGQTLNHFHITGPNPTAHGGIFGGMDGDGICETSRFTSTFGCGTGMTLNNSGAIGPLNYAPDGVTLTATGTNSGFVDFNGGLAPGALGIFSLEEPAGAQGISFAAPEPASLSLLGVGLAALGLRRFRRKA